MYSRAAAWWPEPLLLDWAPQPEPAPPRRAPPPQPPSPSAQTSSARYHSRCTGSMAAAASRSTSRFSQDRTAKQVLGPPIPAPLTATEGLCNSTEGTGACAQCPSPTFSCTPHASPERPSPDTARPAPPKRGSRVSSFSLWPAEELNGHQRLILPPAPLCSTELPSPCRQSSIHQRH